MFTNCKSLISIFDFSKWDVYNIPNMSYIFFHCISLSFLPDIGKQKNDISNNINYMFENCFSTISSNDYLKNINMPLFISNQDNLKNEKPIYSYNLANGKKMNEFQNKNIIKGILDIKSNEINSNITLFNSEINEKIDVFLN